MKPVFALFALALALGGCTAADKSDKTAQTPAPDASVADAALSQDTKAICEQADRTGTAFGTTLTADLKLQLEAKGKGAAATAQAKQKLTQDVSNYSYALGDMSRLASDATLKSTLKQMSDQVTAFSGDLTKIDATKLSALSDTLDRACGKG
jgi:PBP1b-binding outer membrane lipoprotein LpoB